MSKLTDTIKNINKKYKTNIIGDKDNVTFAKKDEIPFITPTLTYLFHGGLPTNSLLEISGEYSSGKSSLCFSIVGQAQKKFKQDWQDEVESLKAIEKPTATQKARLAELLDSGEKRVVYLDSEHSADKDWMTKNGVDLDSIIFIFPQEESAEELLQSTLDLAETGQVGLIIIDSLATLVSQQAFDKELTEKTYCGISGAMTTWSAKILPMLTKYDMTVICVNQERAVLNSMFPATSTPGGKAYKFACHVRLSLRKGRFLDKSYKELTNGCESSFGSVSKVQVLKNKLTKPDRRMTEFTITYDNGIDYMNDAFNLGVALGVIDKSGAWYSIIDTDTGEPKIDEEGDVQKFQGKQNFIKYMREHKDFTDSLIKTIEEKCK